MLTPRELFEATALAQRLPTGPGTDGAAVRSWRFPELHTDAQFGSYLTLNGWSPIDLNKRLTSTETSDIECEWIEKLSARNSHASGETVQRGPYRFNVQELHALPFERFFKSFLSSSECHIHNVFKDALNNISIEQSAYSDIERSLANRILDCSLYALINSYHESGLSYAEYNKVLGTVSGREALFRQYPVLARRLNDEIDNHEVNITHMVLALDRDFQDLCRARLVEVDRATVDAVELNLGDPHDRGRSVAIVTLGSRKIVFRPRSSPEYAVYKEIVEAAGLEAYLPTLNSLNRSSHAWVEHAQQATSDQILMKTHFHRMGVLAGLTYALGSTDMHMENVIATPRGPVPVDAETILGAAVDQNGGSEAFNLARAFLNDSALGTGILPVGVRIGGSDDFEVSALAGGTRASSGKYEAVVDPYGDSIAIEHWTTETGKGKNAPLGTGFSDVASHSEDTLAGFKLAVSCIQRNVDSIVAVLDLYRDIEVRVILRPTSLYDLARRALRHPRHLRSMLAAEKFLLRFWKPTMSDVLRTPRVHQFETSQLLAGDIPRFTVTVGGRYVKAEGEEVAELRESPIERCNRHLRSLRNRFTGRKQSALVQEVLLASAVPRTLESEERSVTGSSASTSVETSPHVLVPIVETFVQRFAEEAFASQGQATWLGMISSEDGGSVRLAPAGTGLFDGLAGISLGLATVYAATGHEGAASLAKQALSPVSDDLRRWARELDGPVGAFGGASGLAYAVFVGQSILGDDSGEYREILSEYVRSVGEAVESDTFFDLGSGAAGAAAVLSCLLEAKIPLRTESLDSLDRAVSKLREGALRLPDLDGRGWIANSLPKPLGGFSHGTSGIGWALARSSRWLDDDSLKSLARDALRFDDNYWSKSVELWQDMRPENHGREVFPVHWCHGAAGIYLARAQANQFLAEAAPSTAVDRAKTALLRHHTPGNDSLCHGSLGNAICLYAGGSEEDGYRYFSSSMHRIRESNFKHGLGFPATSVPGLMLGYSGFMHAISLSLNRDIPPALCLSSRGLRF